MSRSIKVARRTGISLAAIRTALKNLSGERTPTVADWKRLSALWRADLDDRIKRLTRLRDELTGCIGCGCLSLGICSLYNPQDSCRNKGPGREFSIQTKIPFRFVYCQIQDEANAAV